MNDQGMTVEFTDELETEATDFERETLDAEGWN